MSNTTETPLDRYRIADDVLEDEPESVVEARTTWQSLVGRLFTNRDVAILAVGLVIFVFFSVTSNFFTVSNLVNIMRSVSIIGIVAVGMTYLFIAGELDLSVGSHYGFLVTLIAFFVVNKV